MTDGVYKLKNGQKEYDQLVHAVTVAEAKAADEDEAVVICKKLLNRFEEVIRVEPDGSQERLDTGDDGVTTA